VNVEAQDEKVFFLAGPAGTLGFDPSSEDPRQHPGDDVPGRRTMDVGQRLQKTCDP